MFESYIQIFIDWIKLFIEWIVPGCDGYNI